MSHSFSSQSPERKHSCSEYVPIPGTDSGPQVVRSRETGCAGYVAGNRNEWRHFRDREDIVQTPDRQVRATSREFWRPEAWRRFLQARSATTDSMGWLLRARLHPWPRRTGSGNPATPAVIPPKRFSRMGPERNSWRPRISRAISRRT